MKRTHLALLPVRILALLMTAMVEAQVNLRIVTAHRYTLSVCWEGENLLLPMSLGGLTLEPRRISYLGTTFPGIRTLFSEKTRDIQADEV